MLEADASEKEAVQKKVADTVVAGDKCQRFIGDCLEMQSPIVHSSPLLQI